jgi:membrane-associated phospholipid phosphatase
MHVSMQSAATTTPPPAGWTQRLLTAPMTARRACMFLGAALLASVAAMPADAWVMTNIGPYQGGLASKLGGDLVREMEFVQQFGAVTSMVIAGIIILLLDPAKKRGVLHFAIALAINGVVGHALKVFFGRPRPRVLFDNTPQEGFDSPLHFAFAWSKYPLPRTIDGNASYLLAHSWEWWKGISSDLASYPSSHAMASACAAACLAHLYPRLSPLVFTLAVIVAICRVAFGAHYPSDVIFGSVTGFVIGALVMQRTAASAAK